MRQLTGFLVVVVLLGTAAAQAATSRQFLVPVSKQSSGFGPFRQFKSSRPDAAELRRVFGRPDSAKRGDQGQTCVMRWKALGITAKTFRVGDPPNPCMSGVLSFARLTDARWHTAGGIRPGTPAAIAAEASTRSCKQVRCGEVNGYAFGLHNTDCGGRDIANVIAEVKGDKVTALVVPSRGCE